MPVVLHRPVCANGSSPDTNGTGASAYASSDGNYLEIGLINNMPDAALESTERQFLDLLAAAAGDVSVHLRLLALPQVPRSEQAQQYLRARYTDVGEIHGRRLDGLIVTGTEPLAASLRDE